MFESVHFGEDMAVHQEQILPPVVVEVEKTASPSNEPGIASKPGGKCCIFKIALAHGAIQALALVGEIGAENIDASHRRCNRRPSRPCPKALCRSHRAPRREDTLFLELAIALVDV